MKRKTLWGFKDTDLVSLCFTFFSVDIKAFTHLMTVSSYEAAHQNIPSILLLRYPPLSVRRVYPPWSHQSLPHGRHLWVALCVRSFAARLRPPTREEVHSDPQRRGGGARVPASRLPQGGALLVEGREAPERQWQVGGAPWGTETLVRLLLTFFPRVVFLFSQVVMSFFYFIVWHNSSHLLAFRGHPTDINNTYPKKRIQYIILYRDFGPTPFPSQLGLSLPSVHANPGWRSYFSLLNLLLDTNSAIICSHIAMTLKKLQVSLVYRFGLLCVFSPRLLQILCTGLIIR